MDIVILEDSAVEDIERFDVVLSTSSPDPVDILSPDNASVSILDDDSRSHIRKTCLLLFPSIDKLHAMSSVDLSMHHSQCVQKL